MIFHLTPLEETVAGQELIQFGMKQGWQEGFEKGFQQGVKANWIEGYLIGEIRLAQSFLKRPVSDFEELDAKTETELQAIWHELDID